MTTSGTRGPSLSSTLVRKAERFFGLEDEADSKEQLWKERRIRMANRTYGGVKPAAVTLPRPTIDSPDGEASPTLQMPATFPRISKPSVGKYVAEGLTTLGRKIANLPPPDSKASDTLSKSYIPGQTRDFTDQDSVVYSTRSKEVFFNQPPRTDPSPGYNQEVDMFAVQPSDKNRPHVGMARIDRNKFIENTGFTENTDETDKREFGIGVVGEALGQQYRKSVRERPDVAIHLDNMDDYRPYFTYWVTTVQLIVMIITVATYGFGPVGVELHQSSGHVLSRGLYIEQVDYYEPSNFWFGPRPADLIHLGAKFSPCMRRDQSIEKERMLQRVKESETGCCIRNDRSGCVQVRQDECSTLLSTFHKWSPSQPGPDGRSSGPVCGQDPRHCSSPASSYASTWLDEITAWPVCRSVNLPEAGETKWGAPNADLSPAPRHMTCETVARPCCIGIHGKCEIRTKEFCDWVHGHFHLEATLCSQVACMEDVCGMLPFVSADSPDQVYRLLTSLFLHAGLLHLLITIIVQIYLMRDLEKLCGSVRMSIIYLGSGMAGNLASAIFVPYRAESGPAGSQFGILAALIVEVLNVWPALQRPGAALGKLIAITTGFFVLGLLPWVDNYAHIVGFFTGFLLSYALMPYIAFDRTVHTRARRLALIILCLLFSVLIFTVLLVVFYLTPIYECEWCKYFTCIPFTKDFCADQNINFKKDEPIIAF